MDEVPVSFDAPSRKVNKVGEKDCVTTTGNKNTNYLLCCLAGGIMLNPLLISKEKYCQKTASLKDLSLATTKAG